METALRSFNGVQRRAGIVAVIGVAALGLAIVSTSWLRDPVDVVGRPIIDGYSERAETAAWIVFLVACAVLSAQAAGRRWPSAVETAASVLAMMP